MLPRALLPLLVAALIASCGGGNSARHPFVGTWRMKETGATWIFQANGSATVTGRAARWREVEGELELSGAAYKDPQRLRWEVIDGGKALTLTRTSSSGQQFMVTFERQNPR